MAPGEGILFTAGRREAERAQHIQLLLSKTILRIYLKWKKHFLVRNHPQETSQSPGNTPGMWWLDFPGFPNLFQFAALSFNGGVKNLGRFWKKRCPKTQMFTKPVLLLGCRDNKSSQSSDSTSPSALSHPKLKGGIKLGQFLDSSRRIFNEPGFVNSAGQDRFGIFDKHLHFSLTQLPKSWIYRSS